MSWLATAEFKVGLLVLSVATLVAYMSIQVSEDPSYLGRSQNAWFLIQNASGLVKNSSVRMAGIPVGVIKDIRLQDGLARVDLTVRSDVGLRTSAAVEIQSSGILGDKFVAIFPGGSQDDRLPNGGQILNVRDKGSMDNVMDKVGDITDSLASVAKTLQASVENDGTRQHILGRIVQNIEKLTSDLAQISGDNKEQIGEIVDQVNGITKTLNDLINDESDQGFKAAWKKALASLSRIDTSLKNVEEITGKINRGEGTIGRLVNDESTVDELNNAIEGVSGMLDTANKIETGIDFHSDYLGNMGLTKSYVGLRIQPGPDRFYLLGVVDDPAGVVEKVDTKTTGTLGDSNITETKTYHSKVKFTAMFAKNFYDLTVRGGLIENSGGLGLDYSFFHQRLKFSVEAFNFGNMNLRALAQYNFYRGVYVNVGYNDMMDHNDAASGFVGAGILLTNDDLKLLVSKLPF